MSSRQAGMPSVLLTRIRTSHRIIPATPSGVAGGPTMPPARRSAGAAVQHSTTSWTVSVAFPGAQSAAELSRRQAARTAIATATWTRLIQAAGPAATPQLSRATPSASPWPAVAAANSRRAARSGDRGQNRARVMTAWGKLAHIGVVP
jgi:hypothetical protein